MEQEEFEDAALGSSSRVSMAHVLHTGKTVSDDVDIAQFGLGAKKRHNALTIQHRPRRLRSIQNLSRPRLTPKAHCTMSEYPS